MATDHATIRIRWQQLGGHVHCRVFTLQGETFKKNGDLVFDAPEWPAVADRLQGGLGVVELLTEDAPPPITDAALRHASGEQFRLVASRLDAEEHIAPRLKVAITLPVAVDGQSHTGFAVYVTQSAFDMQPPNAALVKRLARRLIDVFNS